MNCAEAAKKFAEWADAAGKPDMPIKVNATRKSIRTEALRGGIEIAARVRGGDLYLGDHLVITLKDNAP